jgi:peptide/nickel transport system permease protein
MACAAGLLGVLLGVIAGVAAAYSRPWIDDVIMRTLDLVLAFPTLVLVLLFVALLGPQLWLIVLLVALAWMPQVARVIRGVAAGIIESDFVQSHDALGMPRREIMFGQVLPNLSGPILVEIPIRISWSVVVIAGLNFLGLGIQPPVADWGVMINENRIGMGIAPLSVLVPAVLIALVSVGVSLVAEALSRHLSGAARR